MNMGSLVIGVIVSAVFLGISFVQTFYYYTNYHNDPWYLRALVAMTVTLDTIHLALISHSVYRYLITDYGNRQGPNYMVNIGKESTSCALSILTVVQVEVLLTGLTGALVQSWYLTRLWFSLTAKAFPLKTWFGLPSISAITVAVDALTTVTDILIAASLCWYLRQARTGFKSLTSLCALAALISVLASPTTLIFAAFYFNLGRRKVFYDVLTWLKVYTNSLLAALNARKSIAAGDMDDISHVLISMPPALTNGDMRRSQQTFAINVQTTQERSRHGETLGTPANDKIHLNRLPSDNNMRKSHALGEEDVDV
ncbi:hypothetical protein DXG01_008792 [Tephrocybe rancida]|nr:hypothetical protein DXG01_008792 [Tephrocybe rancida]